MLSRTARSAAASGGLRSLTRMPTRTQCYPCDQGRFLGLIDVILDLRRQFGFSIFLNILPPLARFRASTHIKTAQAAWRMRILRPGPSGRANRMSLKEDMPCELTI